MTGALTGALTRALSDRFSVTTEELLVNRRGDYYICCWVKTGALTGALSELFSNYIGVTAKQGDTVLINYSVNQQTEQLIMKATDFS